MKCNKCGWENSTKSYGIDKDGHWICSDCKMTELTAEVERLNKALYSTPIVKGDAMNTDDGGQT